mmetsp:Transcript_49233/g.88515  ORF Transcript_49233/g.88515 Transcript_49233/m.88515 type:complete len:275 (+) Transcript_49233:1106-1930(+)
MAQGRRLYGEDELGELGHLHLETLAEALAGACCLKTFDDAGWRYHKRLRIEGCVQTCFQSSGRHHEAVGLGHLSLGDRGRRMGEGELGSFGDDVPSCDGVDDAVLLGSIRVHRPALKDHRQGHGQGCHAWKALSALGARKKAEIDLREANLRLGRGHAVVASKADLAAAAQGRPIESRHHSLRRCVNHVHHLAQGFHRVVLLHLFLAHGNHQRKLSDFGTSTEHGTIAGDDDALDLGVRNELWELFLERGHQTCAEGVDRWAVHGDHTDAIGTH